MKVRGGKQLPRQGVQRILIRGTNWIGDAILTLPAVAAIRRTYPRARLSMLVKPWVAEVFHFCRDVDEVVLFQDPGIHSGVPGKLRLARDLRGGGYDMAILLQNAIEAAIVTFLAGIPIRAGYNSDGRGALLTHSVQRTKAIREVHQTLYYLEMVKSLGCESAEGEVRLVPSLDDEVLADRLLESYGLAADAPLVGIAPGATFGPAKKWFPERFAAVADRLSDAYGVRVLIFGSGADRASAEQVSLHARNGLIDLAGRTNLKEAMTLIARCRLFISNDSGLMHVAAALGIPTVAIFGSTNPITTSPVGDCSIIVRKEVSCSPCLKMTCPTDFRCMDLIGVDDVYHVAEELLAGGGR